MAAPIVQLRRAPQKGEPLRGQVVVGKDILELLSTAMYLDPLSILREYVQNAADAIDSAHAQGVLRGGEVGRIDLEVHSDTRELVVRDNGVGVPAADVERVLASFGASEKRGKGLRGFRGVGRLGGLAYARALTFRTRWPVIHRPRRFTGTVENFGSSCGPQVTRSTWRTLSAAW